MCPRVSQKKGRRGCTGRSAGIPAGRGDGFQPALNAENSRRAGMPALRKAYCSEHPRQLLRRHRFLSGISTRPATRWCSMWPLPSCPTRKSPPTSATSMLPDPFVPITTSLLTFRMSTEPEPSAMMFTLPTRRTVMSPDPSVMLTLPATSSMISSPERGRYAWELIRIPGPWVAESPARVSAGRMEDPARPSRPGSAGKAPVAPADGSTAKPAHAPASSRDKLHRPGLREPRR